MLQLDVEKRLRKWKSSTIKYAMRPFFSTNKKTFQMPMMGQK